MSHLRLTWQVILAASFFSGCVTMSAPGPGEQILLDRLEKQECRISSERIYRITILRGGDLVGVFDLENGPRPGGRFVSTLRGEAMDEIFSMDFDSRMNPSSAMDLHLDSHRISGNHEQVRVDGRLIPLGPGELICLLGGMLPVGWASPGKVMWDRNDRKFISSGKHRKIRFASGVRGNMDVDVNWSPNWFSSASIRVIISRNSPDGMLQGTMEGPYGILIKWIEV